jgi:hypothetical protein
MRKPSREAVTLTVSIVALAVSVVSPFANYRWLNQVERDDRDRKQVLAWITSTGSDASIDFSKRIPKGKPVPLSVSSHLSLWFRKGGALPVGNVHFLLQFDPGAVNMRIKTDSLVETETPSLEGNGRVRIRLKNPLAPTARDLRVDIWVSASLEVTQINPARLTVDLKGAWLFTDAVSGSPISVPPPLFEGFGGGRTGKGGATSGA